MVVQFKIQEISTAYVNVEADTEEEACKALDNWMEDPKNDYRLIDWLDRGFEGRAVTIESVTDDDELAPPDIYAKEVV